MREVVSILLPGAEDTIEVEVDYIHHDAFMAGAKDGGDSPYYIYRQIGESRSFPEAEALARESADWDRIEIRSGCGELVAVLNRGKWTSTLAGKRPTYDGGKA